MEVIWLLDLLVHKTFCYGKLKESKESISDDDRKSFDIMDCSQFTFETTLKQTHLCKKINHIAHIFIIGRDLKDQQQQLISK